MVLWNWWYCVRRDMSGCSISYSYFPSFYEWDTSFTMMITSNLTNIRLGMSSPKHESLHDINGVFILSYPRSIPWKFFQNHVECWDQLEYPLIRIYMDCFDSVQDLWIVGMLLLSVCIGRRVPKLCTQLQKYFWMTHQKPCEVVWSESLLGYRDWYAVNYFENTSILEWLGGIVLNVDPC